LRKGTSQWSPPQRVAHDPFRSVGNAVIWEGPGGTVWLFYVVRYGATWSTSRVQVKFTTRPATTRNTFRMAISSPCSQSTMTRPPP
ncbi:MAG: exo-alpha-sialidase, partial [Isosphaeraceae bacterium]